MRAVAGGVDKVRSGPPQADTHHRPIAFPNLTLPLAPLAQQAGLTIAIAPLEELCVCGDRLYLSQMVANLIENALKYSAGIGTQVRIAAGSRRHGDRDGVWLQVADDGPGIAAEHLPHLCERFYRVDDARTHSYGASGTAPGTTRPTGSGLGLAIAQWIVQAHGGALRVTSEVGDGATFDLWMPVADEQEAAPRDGRAAAT